eukprot:CAMPEP_0174359206 /NCGR_PEP_ID=MMETSP0811_2-20130205/47135_1 /TAXON_ID=73025 ORGANISM="Eutreptiella gymnastica-like, Strain CCMP1594" /NCGR_SAMPLE_ID=MMETSP0811_2 /ASSEMBLY_ACC=CAM_ASM_000667 /LENGTH=111 /DNA_ID=CAMNT_0015493671 /DNA_START=338 /DNA_END=674 /DNA_ORIENTATION=+
MCGYQGDALCRIRLRAHVIPHANSLRCTVYVRAEGSAALRCDSVRGLSWWRWQAVQEQPTATALPTCVSALVGAASVLDGVTCLEMRWRGHSDCWHDLCAAALVREMIPNS